MKKLLMTFIMAMILALSTLGSVYASSSSLTIKQTKPGMNVHLYEVAKKENGSYSYTDAFKEAASTNIHLNELNTSAALSEAATTLKGYAQKTTGLSQKASTSQMVFDHLEDGLYLILVDPYTTGGVTYNYSPVLIDFPTNQEIELTKYSPSKIYKYSLVKHWQGSGKKPSSIVVDLYNGSKLEKTLTLTKANGYAYSWQSQEVKDYSIVEHTVEGYASSVETSESGDTQYFVLTNTSLPNYNSGKTPSTSTTTSTERGTEGSKNYQSGPSTSPSQSETKQTSSKNPDISTRTVKTGDTTSINNMVYVSLIAGLILIVAGRSLRN